MTQDTSDNPESRTPAADDIIDRVDWDAAFLLLLARRQSSRERYEVDWCSSDQARGRLLEASTPRDATP
jgi:hypothetical protein